MEFSEARGFSENSGKAFSDGNGHFTEVSKGYEGNDSKITQNTGNDSSEKTEETGKKNKKLGAIAAINEIQKLKREEEKKYEGEAAESGNAMEDGATGVIGVMKDMINPMTYLKALWSKLGMILAPYVLLYGMIAVVIVVVIVLMYQIMMPIVTAEHAMQRFMQNFTGEIFINDYLTENEIEDIIEDSGADETQATAMRYALSRVGYEYSQANRASGTAFDCSSLVYYAWEKAGVDISFGGGWPPTAASEAQMLNEAGCSISMEDFEFLDIEPGDLIFYGGDSNGRYLGIYHVAMYVGNGNVVEALSTKYGVVYQTLRIKNVVMVCRPYVSE